MQNNLLSVRLLVDEHIQVILLILDVDRNIDACSTNSDGNRLGVVLIFEEESKVLRHCCQFQGHKCELNLGWRVTVNFSCAFERDLC